MDSLHTEEESDWRARPGSPRQPGVVVIYRGDAPCSVTLPLIGGKLRLGREVAGVPSVDSRASREHVELQLHSGTFQVRDLSSTNGTFVDGRRIEHCQSAAIRLVRFGHTLVLPTHDITPFARHPTKAEENLVQGASLQEMLSQISEAATQSPSLLIQGESGTGKEHAAHTFHRAGPCAAGPFISVNCATIAQALAERLLFGARKGAYSGAAESTDGLIQAAHRGTLFLDELAELPLEVQAKLLRVVESQEVLPLGATRPIKVDVRWCAATHRDLRAAIAQGHFRADLFYRLARSTVRLPPLRERLEEVPWLIAAELAQLAPSLRAHPRFVEEALLRPWPGNVREIRAAVQEAGRRALGENRNRVMAEDWPATAGVLVAPQPPPVETEVSSRLNEDGSLSRQAIVEALQHSFGNVSAAAQQLNIHRTQLYRLMKRHRIDS